MQTQRVRHAEHFRTVSVLGFPRPGALSSEIMGSAGDKLAQWRAALPPGYNVEIAGEQAKSQEGFGQLITVMRISIALFFMALVFQFRSAEMEALIVFAGVAVQRGGGDCWPAATGILSATWAFSASSARSA